MKIQEKIKHYMGERVFEKHVKTVQRRAKMCNVKDARSIGIIFNANQVITFEIIRDLTKDFADKGVEVDVLGYVDDNNLVDHYLYRKGFHFFSKAQLNWYYLPSSEEITMFMEKNFDILMNLSLENVFPIDYVFAMSKAKFKVGKQYEQRNFADLMIDTSVENLTMHELQSEISESLHGQKFAHNYETAVKPKIETEFQLNFLIQQMLHYLKCIKVKEQAYA